MFVIFFLLPLALSLAAGVIVLFGSYHWIAKAIVVALVAASVLLQFVPALREHVHFLVPLSIQIWQVPNPNATRTHASSA